MPHSSKHNFEIMFIYKTLKRGESGSDTIKSVVIYSVFIVSDSKIKVKYNNVWRPCLVSAVVKTENDK